MYIKSLTAGKINSPIYIYIYIRCTLSYFFKIKIKIKIAIKRCNKTYRRELRPKQFSTKARDLFVPQKWKKKKNVPLFLRLSVSRPSTHTCIARFLPNAPPPAAKPSLSWTRLLAKRMAKTKKIAVIFMLKRGTCMLLLHVLAQLCV